MMNGDDDVDTLDGSAGDDVVYGSHDVDTLYGRAGNDTLNGGNEHDRCYVATKIIIILYGQDGNDELNGESGVDDTSSSAVAQEQMPG